jgi:hypothetical protein
LSKSNKSDRLNQIIFTGVELRKNRFEWNFLGKNLLAMTIEGFLFFGLTLAIEFGLFDPLWQWILVKFNVGTQLNHGLGLTKYLNLYREHQNLTRLCQLLYSKMKKT